MQDLGTQRGQFQHFLKGDLVKLAGFVGDPRVGGVDAVDPRITDKARKLDKIAFEEMLELASLGAKVLQTRSVELAMRF
ncbi:MAG: hypothetical protein AAFW64_10880, partial [Pseudomonadota bacterium]